MAIVVVRDVLVADGPSMGQRSLVDMTKIVEAMRSRVKWGFMTPLYNAGEGDDAGITWQNT
jgi:hypothetical protein